MQKKVTILIGEPATGKTSLVRRLMGGHIWMFHNLKWVPHHSTMGGSAILGDYSDANAIYAGTDKLSMAVQPHARKWIKDSSYQRFLFEGDRLGNMKFINELVADGHDVKVLRLTVDAATRRLRSQVQGREQDEKFLKSRNTKLLNMSRELASLPGMTYQELPHINTTDMRFIIANLTRSDSLRRI